MQICTKNSCGHQVHRKQSPCAFLSCTKPDTTNELRLDHSKLKILKKFPKIKASIPSCDSGLIFLFQEQANKNKHLHVIYMYLYSQTLREASVQMFSFAIAVFLRGPQTRLQILCSSLEHLKFFLVLFSNMECHTALLRHF